MLSAAATRLPRRSIEWLILAAIVAFGFWTRVSGFNHATPWFDDAWVVLASHVPLSTAFHMVNTTPLFTLGMRWWILLHPGALWWDQLPVFVLGLGTIVAVYFLLRYFRLWWPLPFLGALIIAASPIAVLYSTRVKQYNLDLLFGCAVLWLFERWRRAPTKRGAIAFAVVSALAILTSATTAIVVAPACLVMAHAAWVERGRVREAAGAVGAIAAVGVIEYVVWLRHLSHGLDVGWTNRGYLLTFKSKHLFGFSIQNMTTEFFHYMVGVPTGHPPDPSKIITHAGYAIAAVVIVLFAGAIAWALVPAVRRFGRVAGPMVVPAGAIACSAVLALAGKAPFGGGRTDEIIYPAVLVLFGGLLTRVAHVRWRRATAVLLVGALAATGAMALVGARNRAIYPTIALGQLYHELAPHVTADQFIVVDPWLSFGWSVDRLTPTAISLQRELLDWSQGFHVVSLDDHVIISPQYFFPEVPYAGLYHYATTLWYVGESGGPQWPAVGPTDRLYLTRNFVALEWLGWEPVQPITAPEYSAAHVVAIELHYVAADNQSLKPGAGLLPPGSVYKAAGL